MNDLEWLNKNIHECLSYNNLTGIFTWKNRPLSHFKNTQSYKSWNTKFANKVAGNKTLHKDNQYISIKINGIPYKAHRIAILMEYGYMPVEVDHTNGIYFDNRIENLDPCDRSKNSKNLSTRKDSKLKIMGIKIERGRYRVRIQCDKNPISIGTYNDFFEACCARKSAENKYGFHLNHGRNKNLDNPNASN